MLRIPAQPTADSVTPPVLRGLVLAGGDSRRMGRDKAALEYSGESLLQRAVAQLQAHTAEVYVSVRKRDPLRDAYRCIVDRVDLRGPAAGLLSAHDEFPDSAWLVVACDMPLVGTQLLQELVGQRDPDAPATCWRGQDGRPEPLCTVYEPATLAAFQQFVLAGGSASPRDWLAQISPRVLQTPDPGRLQSANTPQDWQLMRQKHD